MGTASAADTKPVDQVKALKEAREQDKQRTIQKYDANRNGKIDPEERGAIERDKAALLQRTDTNRNRKLDKAELDRVKQEAELKLRDKQPTR